MTRFIQFFSIFMAAGLTAGCFQSPDTRRFTRVSDKINITSSSSGSSDSVSYIARFDSAQEASKHSDEVKKIGGTSRSLDREGRVLALSASRDSIDRLELPDSATASANTRLSVRPSTGEVAANAELVNTNDAQAFLTARNVTGVTELLRRFPEADGRNVKVAVFDSGIDFGVQGLETFRDGRRKLVGFYDLSGFGKVALSPITEAPTDQGTTYTHGGRTLIAPTSLAAKEVRYGGVLSEPQLARDYYADGGIDLDQNGFYGDEFLFLVGRNRDGHAAVWVDRNKNGVVDEGSSDESEELTDYNTTFDFLNMDRSTPSGAKPIGVTISETAEGMAVQFHSVESGHGTSCAIIIAGDSYARGPLSGMAPQATLVSYVLDTTGQDGYTIDEFLGMFIHAKEQQVDAISISWGFTTADLESARFVADFLDREIASAGIVIALAAGNNGPGVSSGHQDDYMPHHGFSVGAQISKVQARNVYNWTGDLSDEVIFYSSFGPTKGGRQVPDVVSPLMTLVRGERGINGQRFYGFGGTSSATPALVGSISALASVIKDKTGERLDARLLKLAIQNSAAPISGTTALRQGQGLINVNAALDVYLKLHQEFTAAKKDPLKRTSFAYDVRAAVALETFPQTGEGIHLYKFEAKKTVKLKLTAESLSLIDSLVFFEPVRLVREGDFFDTQDMIGLQGLPVSFDVTFLPHRMKEPGTYIGRVSVARDSDGLILATIPLVVEVPHVANTLNQVAAIDQTIKPLEMVRRPLFLAQPSQIVFQGMVSDSYGLGTASELRVSLITKSGNLAQTVRLPLNEVQTIINARTKIVPAGHYELVAYRTFKQPSVLKAVDLKLAVSLPSVSVAAADWSQSSVSFALKVARPLAAASAKLILDKEDQTVTLTLADSHPDFSRAIKGFYGESELSVPQTALGLRLTQSKLNHSLRSMANMELVAIEKGTSKVLYRGWKNFDDVVSPSPAEAVTLSSTAQNIAWLAFPNIVKWDRPSADQTLTLDVTTGLSQPVVSKTDLTSVPEGVVVLPVTFEIAEADRGGLKAGVQGQIELTDGSGKILEVVPVRL